MDRLKGVYLLVSKLFRIYLHSSMDRLKGKRKGFKLINLFDLHSSMDRLKAILVEYSNISALIFTFQYG